MFTAVAAGYLFALAAPWLAPRPGSPGLRWLALVPAALALFFASHIFKVNGLVALDSGHDWIPSLGINLAFRLDGLSLIFALIITVVGAFILLYAAEYHREHPHGGRFQAYLLAFMASMLGLVLSANLIVLFVFWELTSIFSFLLIGFEHGREKARKAALQALLVTGLGGLAMLAGFILLGQMAGTYDIGKLMGAGDSIRENRLYAPAVALIMLGAFTKSAQFPFHFWLPGAMEAPTPASAYLHSSTMVKAGIYLLARFTPILGGTPLWENTLLAAGGTTMLVSAWLALGQVYLKPLLAYGTVWALGVMVVLLGLGTPQAIEVAMVLLVAHSLYKACLFMVAGILDRMTGEKNVEKLGGLKAAMPITALVALAGGVSMAGLPPSLGFIAKELLLEVKLLSPSYTPILTALALVSGMAMFFIAAMVTWRPFFGNTVVTPKKPEDPGWRLLLGPVALAGSGLVFGMISWPLAQEILSPAVSSVLQRPESVELSLWHGLTLALMYSAAILAGGVTLYVFRARMRSLLDIAPLRALGRFGPESAYSALLAGMLALARVQTRLLQGGSLGLYLTLILTASMAAAGFGLLSNYGLTAVRGPSDIRWYEAALVLFMAISALVVVLARSRMLSIAALGAVGFGTVLLFLFLGAPDLALTQFLIEIMTVIMLLLAFYHLPAFATLSRPRTRIFHALLAVAAGVFMFLMIHLVVMEPPVRTTSEFFAANSVENAHGRNIVNVILVDFRGLDTLGEIGVLAVAALGVTALLKFPGRKDKAE